MTPCRGMVVPPPLSAYTLSLPSPAAQVAFSATSQDVAVLLSDATMAIYTFASHGRYDFFT